MIKIPLKSLVGLNFCLYKRNSKRKVDNGWKHSWIRGMSAAVVGEDFRMCNRHNKTPTYIFGAEKDLVWKHIAETADSMRIFQKARSLQLCHKLYTTVAAPITTKNKRKTTHNANNWQLMTESNTKCNKLRSLRWHASLFIWLQRQSQRLCYSFSTMEYLSTASCQMFNLKDITPEYVMACFTD